MKTMITKADEAALRDKGYTQEEINKLKPEEAGRILEGKTEAEPVPEGVPASRMLKEGVPEPGRITKALIDAGVSPEQAADLGQKILDRANEDLKRNMAIGAGTGGAAGAAYVFGTAPVVGPAGIAAGATRGAALGGAAGAGYSFGKAAIGVLRENGITAPTVLNAVKSLVSSGGSDAADTVKNWANNTFQQVAGQVPKGRTAIARAANLDDTHVLGGINGRRPLTLADVATTPQMAGGGLLDLERIARKTSRGIGSHIASKFDQPAQEIAGHALRRAIGRINPETADATQASRANSLDSTIPIPTDPTATFGSPEYYQQVTDQLLNLEDRVNTFGPGGRIDPDVAFARLRRLPDAEFNRILAKDPAKGEIVRQGFTRYLADTTRDPSTGAYHFDAFRKLVDQNAGKLGPQYADMKVMADGLEEMQRSWDMTNTKARSLLASTIGAAFVGAADVVFAGASPTRLAMIMGGEYLFYKYGAPAVVDLLMQPRNLADLNVVLRMASKPPEGSVEPIAKKAWKTTTKNLRKMGNQIADSIDAKASAAWNPSGVPR
jgi:hypothetical protein